MQCILEIVRILGQILDNPKAGSSSYAMIEDIAVLTRYDFQL
jgi:hypothetical protein